MSLVYFDTSALLKVCLAQAGSTLAGRLWDGASAVLTSRLTDVEGRSALAAGHRTGLLDQDQWGSALAYWEHLWPALYLVELSKAISDRAAFLTDLYPLRGGDAIHVASVAALGPGVLVASWDQPVRRAAVAQGLTVVPPVGHQLVEP